MEGKPARQEDSLKRKPWCGMVRWIEGVVEWVCGWAPLVWLFWGEEALKVCTEALYYTAVLIMVPQPVCEAVFTLNPQVRLMGVDGGKVCSCWHCEAVFTLERQTLVVCTIEENHLNGIVQWFLILSCAAAWRRFGGGTVFQFGRPGPTHENCV